MTPLRPRRVIGILSHAALACAVGLGLLPLAAHHATAQQLQAVDPESRLSRLDPQIRHQLQMLFDSAAAHSLSPDLLVTKSLEGMAKGRPGPQIVIGVRRYLDALIQAQGVLGDQLRADELVAAAGAVQAGVAPTAIAKLRNSRIGHEITVPLVVLGDLVSRGVPTDNASSIIIRLTQGGALDSDFNGLWHGVEQDIVSGVPPAAALDRRAREVPGRGAPGTRVPATPPNRSPDAPSSQ